MLLIALALVASGEFEQVPCQTGPSSIETRVVAGAGGHQRLRAKAWDGYLAVATGSPTLRVLGPIGGCNNSMGELTKTSANSVAHQCQYAVNGGPFHMDTGGCIGPSVGNGSALCADCKPFGAGFGIARSATHAQWIMGEKDATTLRVTEWVTGFGWLVRNGTVTPKPGGPKAPRTAIGVTAAGALLIFEVDGCEDCPAITGGPTGLTEHDMGAWMLKLGALHAINLDGGGSSTSVANGTVIDWPTSKHIPYGVPQERAVSTAVCLM